jgi:hypothetical protein
VAGAALLLVLPSVTVSNAQSTDDVPANAVRLLNVVQGVSDSVAAGDWASARSGWNDFDNMWNDVEDGFRATSRDDYRAIEDHQGTIRGLLRDDAPDVDRINGEISAIRDLIAKFGPSM